MSAQTPEAKPFFPELGKAILDANEAESFRRESVSLFFVRADGVIMADDPKRYAALTALAADLAAALEPFASVYSVNSQLRPADSTALRDYCPGTWPTMGDAKKAENALARYRAAATERGAS